MSSARVGTRTVRTVIIQFTDTVYISFRPFSSVYFRRRQSSRTGTGRESQDGGQYSLSARGEQ